MHSLFRYEGAGLTRHIHLSASNPHSRLITHGISAPAYVGGDIHTRATPADGLWSDSAVVTPSAEIMSDANIFVTFNIFDASGTLVGFSNASHGGGKDQTVTSSPISFNSAELWSIPRPYLYTLQVIVSSCPTWPTCEGRVPLDSGNTSIGIRSIEWDPDRGLFLNQQPVKMRGFCNHESFAGVGAAIPDRVDLLRVQQMRGMGGNAWCVLHGLCDFY